MSKTNKRVRAVIHWVNDEKVSIEDIRMITNEEDRYRNANTVIKIGSKTYQARIRLISSDDKELTECEEAVAQEIDERLKAKQMEEEKKGRGKRRKRAASPSIATPREVSLAVGEKPRLAPEHAEPFQERAKARKELKHAEEDAQDEIDRNVFDGSARRVLFGENTASHSMDLTEEHDESCSNNEDDALTTDGEDEDEGQENADKEIDENLNLVSTAEISPGSKDCCTHCRELFKKGNKHNTAQFINSLHKIFSGNRAYDDDKQYVEVLPVPEGQPKIEISKGSGVFMSVADKNMIRNEAKGDPAKMVRLGLLALYGRETIEREEVTAKGTKKGTKAMRESVRSALLGFVNRNAAPEYIQLTKAKFHRIINRKKHQVQRSRSPPSKDSKKASKNKTSAKPSKKKDEIPGSPPSKKKEVPGPKPSKEALSTPTKLTSPSKSASGPVAPPAKATPSPWKVTSQTPTGNPSPYRWPNQHEPQYHHRPHAAASPGPSYWYPPNPPGPLQPPSYGFSGVGPNHHPPHFEQRYPYQPAGSYGSPEFGPPPSASSTPALSNVPAHESHEGGFGTAIREFLSL